ncbi:MAG TPA: FlgD immunoglobulin-like domain containing protein [Candidatus Paceibacterota bacterium]|nr:FlgD immunoglobulin-like domain containing protein [Candidatus Paceibacterota bacterium]
MGAELVTATRVEQSAFNPSDGEVARLTYKLSSDVNVTVVVLDADGGVVRKLAEGAVRKAGANAEVWDGRDEDNKVVPDEAYSFKIETSVGEINDTAMSNGGIVGDITRARCDRESGTLVYELPTPARVLVRLGIKNGPMHKTLVDWRPRIGGSITESWDGRDEHGLFALREHKDFNAMITYITLPKATVIAYGNDTETYREYKLGRGKDRAQKSTAASPLAAGQNQVRPTGLVPPAWARAPKVLMTFPALPEAATGVPTIRGTVGVRVDVDPTDKEYLAKDQFEVIFFVDNVFFAEAERGYLPYNFRWETEELPEGDHILTVNVSSFKGQVGVASRKVRVEKRKTP